MSTISWYFDQAWSGPVILPPSSTSRGFAPGQDGDQRAHGQTWDERLVSRAPTEPVLAPTDAPGATRQHRHLT